MMTGTGPFGAVGMGGMFSVVKVRGPEAGDYSDPGWFQHPPGTVAYEVGRPDPGASPPTAAGPAGAARAVQGVEVKVRKPGVHSG